MTLAIDQIPSPRSAVRSDGAPALHAPALQWRSPERDLWVAQAGIDGYAGMVERVDADYLATSGRGSFLGVFETLADAELAVSRAGERTPGTRSLAVIATLAGVAAVVTAVAGVVTLH